MQRDLDARVIADAMASPYTDYAHHRLSDYARRTGRGSWPEALAFVESGLAGRGRAPERFAELLLYLYPRPDAHYVRSVLARRDLPDAVTDQLRRAFALQ